MPYRALLIGNWQYEDPDKGFGVLNGPKNDLRLMQEALTDTDFGLFDDVETRTNLPWAKLRGELFKFLSQAKPDDSLLVYFSGHGDRLGDGRLALCGIDTESASLAATSFDTNELREWIDDYNRAPATMVILDCCYSGAMKGAVSEADITASLGSGTMVLSSGGSEPTKDGTGEEDPSPFTAALTGILTNPTVTGDADGYLSVDEVYERLRTHQPPLLPPPKRNQRIQGTFPLARRTPRGAPARDPLIAYNEPEIEDLDIRFKGSSVQVSLESDDDVDELELAAFADYRMTAVKRMSQLADAVLRTNEYEGDEWAQRAVRRAWNCVGIHLFETGLPSSARQRLRSFAEPAGVTQLLKVRLTFEEGEPATALESYPWEYLYREADPEDRHAQEPRPIALSPGMLVERVVHADGPPSLETTLQGATSVGILNSQRDLFGDAVAKIATGLTNMPDLNVVFAPRGGEAQWGPFLDAIEQRPKLLVISAPVRRGPQGVEIGFWPYDRADADWHPAKDLISHFQIGGFTFSAIVLMTFAGRPAQDAVRATSELAGELAKAGIGPVVFVSHAPGYAKYVPERGEDTFPVLFIDVLTRGKRLDRAVYYAKNRVSLRGTLEARWTFGVPGYYVIEPAVADGGEGRTSGTVGTAPVRPRGMSAPPPKEKPAP